jgi:hypothetical protein
MGAHQGHRQCRPRSSLTEALRVAASATVPRVYWQKRVEQELVESRTEGLQPFEFAELLSQSGATARALEWLERASAITIS